MRFTLAIAALAIACIANAAPKEKGNGGEDKYTQVKPQNIAEAPKYLNVEPDPSVALALSKEWSKACSTYIASETGRYVFDLHIRPTILSLRFSPTNPNCTMYVEANDTVVDVTSPVLDILYAARGL